MTKLVPTLTEVGVRMLPAPAEPRWPLAPPSMQIDEYYEYYEEGDGDE